MKQNIFSPAQIDIIGEVMRSCLVASSDSVSQIMDRRVNITVSAVDVNDVENFALENLSSAVGVESKWNGMPGSSLMLLRLSDMKAMVEILLGSEIAENEFMSDEMNVSAATELMHQILSAVAAKISEKANSDFSVSFPEFFEVTDPNEWKSAHIHGQFVELHLKMSVENSLNAEIVNLLPEETVSELLNIFGTKEEPESDSVPAKESVHEIPTENFAGSSVSEKQSIPYSKTEPKIIEATPPRLEEFVTDPKSNKEQKKNLDLIMSVPLEISVEIGRTHRKVKDILQFSKGSLVVLDKLAGDQVELFVNGQCIAKGDVVVVDDNFGIRINEILRRPDVSELQGIDEDN